MPITPPGWVVDRDTSVREEAMGEDDPRGARWDDVVARFGPAPEAGPGDGP